jgi:NAD(P)-dependent dehydrogenase (short-subunit alcohol dehydrogenase family)
MGQILSSKVIAITGVTRGLGRALVGEFIRLGHKIAGCGRSAESIQKLTQTYKDGHIFDIVDVRNENEVRQWAEKVISLLGAPDILINNAAVINKNAPLWEIPAEEFNYVIDVNIKGVANTIRHFVPAMLKRRTGVIVNLSSGWGRTTDAEVAPYCATKWAIEGLTQAFAQELPDPMATIPLNPGIINTDMLRSCFGESAESYPSPEEWAKKAAPFILKLGRQHNGQPLTVPM